METKYWKQVKTGIVWKERFPSRGGRFCLISGTWELQVPESAIDVCFVPCDENGNEVMVDGDIRKCCKARWQGIDYSRGCVLVDGHSGEHKDTRGESWKSPVALKPYYLTNDPHHPCDHSWSVWTGEGFGETGYHNRYCRKCEVREWMRPINHLSNCSGKGDCSCPYAPIPTGAVSHAEAFEDDNRVANYPQHKSNPNPDLVEELEKVYRRGFNEKPFVSPEQCRKDGLCAVLSTLEAKGMLVTEAMQVGLEDYLAVCIKFRNVAERDHLGLGGENITDLVLAEYERMRAQHRFTGEEFEALKREIRFAAIAEKLDLPTDFSTRRLLSGEFMMEGGQLVLVKDHDEKVLRKGFESEQAFLDYAKAVLREVYGWIPPEEQKDHDRKLVERAIDMWFIGSRGDWYVMAKKALFSALNLTPKDPSDA